MSQEDIKVCIQQDEEEVVTKEDLEKKWYLFGREYSKEKERLLLANCIQVSVETAFRNRIYF